MGHNGTLLRRVPAAYPAYRRYRPAAEEQPIPRGPERQSRKDVPLPGQDGLHHAHVRQAHHIHSIFVSDRDQATIWRKIRLPHSLGWLEARELLAARRVP